MDANELHLAAYRRALRARNRSPRTIQNYEETLLQLAEFHDGADLLDLAQDGVEEYLDDVLDQLSSATAAVRFRALRAFYNWCVAEEFLDRSPMARMLAPSVTDRPVPVIPDDGLRALLKTCAGKDFEDRRDTAIIRLFCEPGSPRVSEMAGLVLPDSVDMRRDQIRVHGKGDKIRDIPFGPKTGQALDRYLLVRRKHRKTALPAVWIGPRGPLTPSGIGQMLERRGEQAGIGHVHPHQLRHTAAHIWYDQGGSEDEAMALFGWAQPMRQYGASARVARAHRAARRTTMADRL
jgi:site-specific recombinase XerD